MDSGRTRRMRRLIRWGRQVLAPIVSSGAAVGTTPAQYVRAAYRIWDAPRPPLRLPWLPLCEFRKTEVRAEQSRTGWTDGAQAGSNSSQRIKLAKLSVGYDRFVELQGLQNLSLFQAAY